MTLTTAKQRSQLILKIFLSQTLSAAVIAGGFLAVRDGLAGTSFIDQVPCAQRITAQPFYVVCVSFSW